MTADFHPKLDHAGYRASIDHHIVHRQCIENAGAIAHDAGMHEASAILFIFTAQDGGQRSPKFFQRDVGDESETSLIDSDQWNTERRQLAADAKHRAIATHNEAEVAAGANFWNVDQWISAKAGVVGSLPLQHDLTSLGSQVFRDFLQHLPHGVGLLAGKAGMVLTNERNVAEYGIHF